MQSLDISQMKQMKKIFGSRANEMIEILNKSLLRHCTNCNETKNVNEFYSKRHECKLCRSERSKLYYLDNKEKFHVKYLKSCQPT